MVSERYVLPTGEIINLSEWRWDVLYDSVKLDKDNPAGSEYTFFRDIQDKDLIDTNMMISSKLPSGWEMVVWRIGLVVGNRLKQGAIYDIGVYDFETSIYDSAIIEGATLDDLILIADRGYAQFLMGQNKIVRQGPIFTFQVGYGIQGGVSTDGNPSTTTDHTAQIGPVGILLATQLSIPIHIRDDDTFKATLTFREDTTLSARTKVWMVLTGWIKRPIY